MRCGMVSYHDLDVFLVQSLLLNSCYFLNFFQRWDLVSAVVFADDGNAQTLGSVATVVFKDGAEWTIQIVEYRYAVEFVHQCELK
jgi:hypothetical protein